ncbi:flagellar hook-length control protein FliK [Planomicrobium stackebrandtii]|uniref:Flagellar hook-length control protein FliK n=1 Tax=Planomicrobium stackebrandtii TaxID=253160 RepID=A0ABU0H0E4_9BACL|nr:flagellar hook-length control protein FliK [Planomicrobium stackebrandtii]MDQ0430674.1 flagellar hook-length control protein FliK [Planomicrobium stackebrandtii]
MEALKLSFPQTISPTAKKAAVPAQQDQALFASLLTSLGTTEAELPSEEQASAEGVLENLESLLALLQEIPVEEQTAEQQELQYAILQLQELQAGNAQLNVTAPSQTSGSLAESTAASAKLLELLENIQQKLQVLSSIASAQSTGSSVVKEAAEQTNSINLINLPQISKQLDELIGLLEKEQQATLAAQQGKSIGQELPVEGGRSVNDIPRFLNETLKPVKELPKVPVETQGTSLQAEEVALQPSVKLQGAEELQSPKVAADSKTAQETTIQPTTSVTAEAVKAAGNQVRTEANPPAAPFVRLSNLLEDLGGMLKSSMRMAETAEGMKMRVNIFPEHLGHLEILLTSVNGKLAAQIMASTPMAKEALELQLNQLRASLVQQGVAVEKIEVLQQSSPQPFSQQQSHAEQRFSQQQHKNGTANRDKNGYFQPEEEKASIRQPSVGQLMKVDYTV